MNVIIKASILALLFYTTTISAYAQLQNENDSLATHEQMLSEKSDAIISYAKKFMGVPYVWGGMSPSGFDCSGFINYVFRGFGFSLTRTSYGLAELGKTIKLSELKPGDLMYSHRAV